MCKISHSKRGVQQTIDDLKTAAEVSTTKSHHQYYILKKYEVLQCGDVKKLLRRESHQKITQFTQESSNCNWPLWSWQDAETSWAKVCQHHNRCCWTLLFLLCCMSRKEEMSQDYRCCCQAYSFQWIQLSWSNWSCWDALSPQGQFK